MPQNSIKQGHNKADNMQWFRLHNKLLNDPVVQTLSDSHFKLYINMLCLASIEGGSGKIGDINSVSFALRETKERVTSCFIALQEAGLVVTKVTDDETFHIPQWNKKQYKTDSSTDRVRDFREKQKRSKTVTVTPPDTDTDTEQRESSSKELQVKVANAPDLKNTKSLALPMEWVLPANYGKWALENTAFTVEQIKNEGERFRDYWVNISGTKGKKKDWLATWRNWMKRAVEYEAKNNGKTWNEKRDDYENEKAKKRYDGLINATPEELKAIGFL